MILSSDIEKFGPPYIEKFIIKSSNEFKLASDQHRIVQSSTVADIQASPST